MSFVPLYGLPQGVVLSPLLFIIFMKGFLQDADLTYKYAYDSTSLSSGAGTFRHQQFGRQKFQPISATIMAERRAIWPCLNVATWRRERSDRAIQQRR